MYWLLFALLLLFVPDPPDTLAIRTDAEHYDVTAGDPRADWRADVTFANGHDVPIRLMAPGCSFTLQKRIGAEWRTVGQPVCLDLYAQPILIEPGASHAEALKLRARHIEQPIHGTYRLHFHATTGTGDAVPAEELYSNPFEIDLL